MVWHNSAQLDQELVDALTIVEVWGSLGVLLCGELIDPAG